MRRQSRHLRLLPVLSLLLLAGCEAQTDRGRGIPDREVISLPGSLEGLPFSSAIRVGHTIYLSGQIGVLPGTREFAPGGTEGQTRQAMENIRTVLEHAGSSMDRIVKCTIFLGNMDDYDAMNRVYAGFFEGAPPARSAFGANRLPLGAALEIECIALAGEAS